MKGARAFRYRLISGVLLFCFGKGLQAGGYAQPALNASLPLGTHVYEAGEIAPRHVLRHAFVMRNDSNIPRVLTGGETSCDCLKVASIPRTIPAHSEIRVETEFYGRKAGRVNISLYVRYFSEQTHLEEVESFQLTGSIPDLAEKYLVAPVEVRQALSAERRRPILADIRSRIQYEAFRIAGSTNIQEFALRARTDWKDEDVIIVHDGRFDDALLDRCAQLEKDGFRSVRLLRGGIRAWYLGGEKLESFAGVPADDDMEPSQVELFARESGSLVVRLDPGKDHLISTLETGMVTLKRSGSSLLHDLADLRRPDGTKPRKILIITEKKDKESVGLTPSANPEPQAVFVLKDGIEGLRRWKSSAKQSLVSETFTATSGNVVKSGGLSIPVFTRPPCSTCPH